VGQVKQSQFGGIVGGARPEFISALSFCIDFSFSNPNSKTSCFEQILNPVFARQMKKM
jgi:hypothetical protein